MFSTGNFDQLIWVSPSTGNSSYAVDDLSQLDNFGFSDDPSPKSDDTYKNNAYDEDTNMLYFQASQFGEDGTPTTSLVSVGPFAPGPLPQLYYLYVNLQPIDFGYQGMQYTHCHPACPT